MLEIEEEKYQRINTEPGQDSQDHRYEAIPASLIAALTEMIDNSELPEVVPSNLFLSNFSIFSFFFSLEQYKEPEKTKNSPTRYSSFSFLNFEYSHRSRRGSSSTRTWTCAPQQRGCTSRRARTVLSIGPSTSPPKRKSCSSVSCSG